MFGRNAYLKPGQKAPEFTLKDQAGREVSLSAFAGKHVVVYFYPKDYTPICTAEACSFRDQYEDFLAAGAEVIGISTDDERSHASFAEKHRLPFTLLSDPGGTARSAYGVPGGIFPGRVTFVIDREGTIVHAFSSALSADKHVAEALQVIRKLA